MPENAVLAELHVPDDDTMREIAVALRSYVGGYFGALADLEEGEFDALMVQLEMFIVIAETLDEWAAAMPPLYKLARLESAMRYARSLPLPEIAYHGQVLPGAEFQRRASVALREALAEFCGGADYFDSIDGRRWRIGVHINYSWAPVEMAAGPKLVTDG